MSLSKIDKNAAVISEDEFLSLPPCIQKKYFSSQERLHIAFQAAADQHQQAHQDQNTTVSGGGGGRSSSGDGIAAITATRGRSLRRRFTLHLASLAPKVSSTARISCKEQLTFLDPAAVSLLGGPQTQAQAHVRPNAHARAQALTYHPKHNTPAADLQAPLSQIAATEYEKQQQSLLTTVENFSLKPHLRKPSWSFSAPRSFLLRSRSLSHSHTRASSLVASTRLAPAVHSIVAPSLEYRWFQNLPNKVRRQLFSPAEREILDSRVDFGTGPYSQTRAPLPYNRSATAALSDDPSSESKYNSIDSEMRHSRSLSLSAALSPKNSLFSTTYNGRDKSRAGTIYSIAQSTDDKEKDYDNENDNALYYQDPLARHKLRELVGSPQKFDEALAFGFPTMMHDMTQKEVQAVMPAKPSYAVISANNDAKAFLQTDSGYISFLDRSDVPSTIIRQDSEKMLLQSSRGLQLDEKLIEIDDEATVAAAAAGGSNDTIYFDNLNDLCDDDMDDDSAGPATPDETDFSWRDSKYNRLSLFEGLDANAMPSLDFKFQPQTQAPTPREMTLRMTLTRPDLRTSCLVQDDPAVALGNSANKRKSSVLQPAKAKRHTIFRSLFDDNGPNISKFSSSSDDPLALQALPPVVEDHSGMQGAFAISEKSASETPKRSQSVFRRIFRSLRK